MKTPAYKVIFGIIVFLFLIYFLKQLNDLPGGFFFSGFLYAVITGIIVMFLILTLTFILKFLCKKSDYLTRILTSSFIILGISIYKLYSPTLKIIVPENYYGEVNLTLSNLSHNELNIDKNGIGYITKWTFEKTYTKPKVYDTKGRNLEKYLLSYDNNKFWGKSIGSRNTIKSLSFEIAKDTLQKTRTYESNWLKNVEMRKVYIENPEKGPDNILEVKIK